MPSKKKEKASEAFISDHPATSLKFVNNEIVAQLVKLPAYLPTEKHPYFDLLKSIRTTFKYAFVYNWLSVFRGCIKMSSDNFNIHIWEEELTGFSTPTTFLNTLKIQIVNALTPKFKIKYVEEFDDALIRILGDELTELLSKFGIEVSDYFDEDKLLLVPEENLENEKSSYAEYQDSDEFIDEEPKKRSRTRGNNNIIEDEEYLMPGSRKRKVRQNNNEDEYSDFDQQEKQETLETKKTSEIKFFDFLPIPAKIDIFYFLITKLNNMAVFQRFVEKFDNQKDLRLDPIFQYQSGTKQFSYFLLDDNRLYLRTLTFNRKTKFPISDLSKFDPFKALDHIDPLFDWTCLTQNFYELYDLIQSFKKDSNLKKLAHMLSDMLDDFATQEVKWKKNYNSRLREKNMQNLLLNRKRSSRLQQKEERKRIEELRRREDAERIIKEAAAIRAAKRMKIKEDKENERLQRLANRHEELSVNNNTVSEEAEVKDQKEKKVYVTDDVNSTEDATATAINANDKIIEQSLPKCEEEKKARATINPKGDNSETVVKAV